MTLRIALFRRYWSGGRQVEDSLLWSDRSLHIPEQNLKAEWRLARQKVSRWASQQGLKARRFLACDGNCVGSAKCENFEGREKVWCWGGRRQRRLCYLDLTLQVEEIILAVVWSSHKWDKTGSILWWHRPEMSVEDWQSGEEGTHERVCLQHLVQEGKSDVSASLKMMSEVKAWVLWYAIRDLALSWCWWGQFRVPQLALSWTPSLPFQWQYEKVLFISSLCCNEDWIH